MNISKFQNSLNPPDRQTTSCMPEINLLLYGYSVGTSAEAGAFQDVLTPSVVCLHKIRFKGETISSKKSFPAPGIVGESHEDVRPARKKVIIHDPGKNIWS